MDRIRKITREYRASQWSELIKECRNSGQTIRAWCEANGVGEKSFYYWQRKFRSEACQVLDRQLTKSSSQAIITSTLPSFAEIQITQPKPEPISYGSESIAVTVCINGITAQIHNGASEPTVETVIRTLREQC
jgi:transposase-like protein